MKYKYKFDNLIKQLCKEYKINKITDMNYPKYKNNYKHMYGVRSMHTNSSTLCGNDEIIFGFYKNPHLKLISALHEIGHTLITKNEIDNIFKEYESDSWTYQIEKLAWIKSDELAKKHNIHILSSSYVWANKQLETYRKE